MADYLIKLNSGDDYIVFGESKLNEGDRDTYTWKQINDVLFDLRMPDKHILMVRKALKKL